MNELKQLEDEILAHRYLYYVAYEPVISDTAYDFLEREARRRLPPESPVHQLGSSLSSDYSQEIIDLANSL